MARYEVAVVGTGPSGEGDPANAGYETTEYSPASRGYVHARHFDALDSCAVVACADIVPEHVAAFGEAFELSSAAVYTDHETLLAEMRPDIVAVCTPPTVRPGIVEDCVATDGVQAVHCEKPMAATPKGCRRILRAAESDVQVTVNRYQRLTNSARRAKGLLEEGYIGDLRRLEMSREDLFEAGIHQVYLCQYFNDDVRPAWVLGALDYREKRIKKGVHNETRTVGLWAYENGVHAVCATQPKDEGEQRLAADAIGTNTRLVGTEGIIERANSPADLRVRRFGEDDWKTVECDDDDAEANAAAIASVVDALEGGTEPQLDAVKERWATEIVFGLRESARRRARVDLPLTIDDDPLAAMVEAGEICPD